MNFIIGCIVLCIIFILGFCGYKYWFEDIMNFVLETNDDVDQYKKDK